MRFRTFLSLVGVLAFTLLSWAQTPSDPQDSGYTSPYLQTFDPNKMSEDESEADDAFLRFEANRQRFGINPEFAGDVMEQAAQERGRFPQLMPEAASSGGAPQWISIGPTKSNHIQNGVLRTVVDSGRARTILPHPTNPDIVYFLTSSGGLWKTTDFTKNKPHWTALTDSLGHTSGGAAAFGRTPETIYLGLGDPFDGNFAAGGFVLKSTDGGAHWGPAVRLTNVGSIRDLKVDTSDPDPNKDVVLVATDFGMFRSADSGASFIRVPGSAFIYSTAVGNFSKFVWSIQLTSAGWVASTATPLLGIAAIDNATGGLGALVRSTDHGATWSALATLSENFTTTDANGNPVTSTVFAGRTTLGVGQPGDSVVYAFAARKNDAAQLDLFRSADGGATWTPAVLASKTPANPNFYNPNMDIMGGQAFYNHMLLVHPGDASRNTVYIGGVFGSAVSTDGGNSWRILANWLGLFKLPYVHADYHAAAFSSLNNTLFFGSDGGMFVSQDGGKTWDDGKNEGIVTTLAYSIATSPTNPKVSIIGTQDNGTFTRVAGTTIWEQTIGGDGLGTAWSQANNDIALGSVQRSSIRRSINNPPIIQNKWQLATTGINRTFATFFTPLATPTALADPTGHVFYHYTTRQLYKTANGAASWQDIGHTTIPGNPNATPPISDTPPSPGIGAARVFRDTPHGIGLSPTADGQNHLGVACLSGFVVITHDGGANWIQTNLTDSATNPTRVPGWGGFNSTVEFADNNTIYIGSENPSPGARVAKSTDGGASFTRADTGLPNVPVARLLVSPADKNTVYAATFLGVYRSTDGGASWSRFGAGLPMVEVDDLNVIDGGKTLRAATYGRGVWEISLQ